MSQAADHLLYRQETARYFTAMPGQGVSIAVDCANPSMADAYVYVDWNADGQFDYSLYDNGTRQMVRRLWPTLMPKTATAAATS